MRILYVHSSLVPPPKDPRADRFLLLSERLEGDVLQPVWFRTPAEVEAEFGAGSFPAYTVGRFRYHWHLSSASRGIRERLATFWFYLHKGFQLHRERRFDCIVAYSHMTTGLLAGVLKLLTGARLIIEIVTTPSLVFITERPQPGYRERMFKAYSDICLYASALLADRMHFLYPGQLDPYPMLRKVRHSVFHEFVPVSIIDRPPAGDVPEAYILLVGAPWYLKGVDVLIAAFLLVSPDYPTLKLKLLGHFPDSDEIRRLTHGSPVIEIMKARPNPEALEIIRRATIMALPSRCEGLARVLLEAMAAGVPMIGSDVGGIPTLVRHGETGFVIPSGDVPALAARLRELLDDPPLRLRMGDAGYKRAHTELNENVYVEKFAGMIEAAVEGRE